MGCGKKEQADTASPTPATSTPATSSTPLTETKELPPSPHGKSGDPPFLRYLKDGETYISPAEAADMKKSDELGYVTGIASGQMITKKALLLRGIRAQQRTQRAHVRKAKRRNKTRKTTYGGRRKARRRPAKRRTKRQRRKKCGSRRRR